MERYNEKPGMSGNGGTRTERKRVSSRGVPGARKARRLHAVDDHRLMKSANGVPGRQTIDNPKCAITRACYHVPEVQRVYTELPIPFRGDLERSDACVAGSEESRVTTIPWGSP